MVFVTSGVLLQDNPQWRNKMPSNNNISDKNQSKDINKARADNPGVKPTDKSLDRGIQDKDRSAVNPTQKSAR